MWLMPSARPVTGSHFTKKDVRCKKKVGVKPGTQTFFISRISVVELDLIHQLGGSFLIFGNLGDVQCIRDEGAPILNYF